MIEPSLFGCGHYKQSDEISFRGTRKKKVIRMGIILNQQDESFSAIPKMDLFQ